MIRRTLQTLSLLILLSAGLYGATTARWFDRLDPAVNAARQSHRLILVDLSAGWCTWCKRLAADVFPTTQFQALSNEFVFLRLDVDNPKTSGLLLRRFSVDSLPTTLLITPELVEVGKVTGFAPAAQYVARIRQQLQVSHRFDQRYSKLVASSDPAILAALADQLLVRADGGRAAPLYRRVLAHKDISPMARPHLELRLGQALRLKRDFAGATSLVKKLEADPLATADPKFAENVDFLRVELAADQGDCSGTQAAVTSFLREHPRSGLVRSAEESLASVRGDKNRCS